MDNELQIRNSTSDFLIFTKQHSEDSINVRIEDETIWLTQEGIATLFDKGRTTVVEHIKNIFLSGELDQNQVCRDFRQTASDGKSYNVHFYNLDMVISVGYRVDSIRATQFRQWATKVLHQFAQKGYVLDKERLKNGQVFSDAYFDHLLDEIREIRASERMFYQKVTDIYMTAYDYDVNSPLTQQFFASVQNKMHYAVHGHTAAEVIKQRADADKEHMGLTTWRKAPKGKIVKADVVIAKNYLTEPEIQGMNELVSMYLDYAKRQAEKHIPMTMEDWAKRLDAFLEFNNENILMDSGTISHIEAQTYAESEFEKYRVIQDAIYTSDFDLFAQAIEPISKKK